MPTFRMIRSAMVSCAVAMIAVVSVNRSPMGDNIELVAPGDLSLASLTNWLSPAEFREDWPPQLGKRYPDLVLKDQDGTPVRLSDFQGKPILIELVAISCRGCQAFAGGNQLGGLNGVRPQSGLKSVHHYAREFAGVELGEEIIFVQLILYDAQLGSPSSEDVANWASHFRMKRDHNQIVLQGSPSLLGPGTYEMIPGFHLIDKDHVLRFDTSGATPADDLYRDLLPAIAGLTQKAYLTQ